MTIEQTIPIHANIYARAGKIYHVELEESTSGFAWDLKGDGELRPLVAEWMKLYLNKQEFQGVLPLDFSTLPIFSVKVLKILQQIPFGNTLSYKEVACLAGVPRGARAVGGACGRNPFPLLVPCHRVLASGGLIGGFSCGLSIKRALLAHEARNAL